ncbi:MAG: BACON domain-containing protein [Chitinophagales bacterium]|nr:BACON domain-containing protein [Chitinophagales bacterium]
MKTQYRLPFYFFLAVLVFVLAVSCRKNTITDSSFLRLSHGIVNIADEGTRTKFTVESDQQWILKFSPSAVDWAELDKTNGNGNSTVTITAKKPALPNGAVRSVDIIATAENNPSIPPIRLMLLQHDSTYKK